jgi:hypothetical protein
MTQRTANVVTLAIKQAALELGLRLKRDGDLPYGALPAVAAAIGTTRRTLERWRLKGRCSPRDQKSTQAVYQLARISGVRFELLLLGK